MYVWGNFIIKLFHNNVKYYFSVMNKVNFTFIIRISSINNIINQLYSQID